MITRMRRLVPALFAVLTACNAPTVGAHLTEIPAGAIDVDWNDGGAVRVAHGYYSGFRQSAVTVIEKDADWRAIWSTYNANRGDPPPARRSTSPATKSSSPHSASAPPAATT